LTIWDHGVESVDQADGDYAITALAATNLALRHSAFATAATSLALTSLTVDADATLAPRDNHLTMQAAQLGSWNGSAYTGVLGLLASGRNGGSWDGAGII